MMRKKPIGGLFSKLVLPRKQWALCSPQDSRSSEPPRFFLRLKECLVNGQLSNEAQWYLSGLGAQLCCLVLK